MDNIFDDIFTPNSSDESDTFNNESSAIHDQQPFNLIDQEAYIDEVTPVEFQEDEYFSQQNCDDAFINDDKNYSSLEDSDVIGEPVNDMEHWHQQNYDDTCAIAAQEFILDSITGHDYSEEELRQQAIDNGWYIPGGGTPLAHVGDLLEANGVEVEKKFGATLEELSEKLAHDQKVIVGVDSEELWSEGEMSWDNFLENYYGIPGQGSDHAVEVIGIDKSDPDNPIVILNDPGHPDGRGMRVPTDRFLNAWEDSSNFMVSTTGNITEGRVENDTFTNVDISYTGMLGGYYNADGTYHWTTTNTDTDPETGATVRAW